MKVANDKHLVYVIISFLCTTAQVYGDPSLIDITAFVANLVYEPHQVTTLIWWQCNPEYVTEFSKHFHGSLVIVPIAYNNNTRERVLNKAVGYKQTVIFADSGEEFTSFITLVNLDLVVPIRLLLVLTKPIYDISEITRIAWTNDVTDILILKQNEAGEVTVYTYFPYNSEICGDFTPVEINIHSKDIFPEKFLNFHGCPIKITLLEIPPYVKLVRKNNTITSITGIDGSALMLIIDKVNASIEIVSSTDHDEMGSFINGTGTGAFGELVNRHADIFIPAAIINRKRYFVAQVSTVYQTLDVYWAAPSRREIYVWVRVFVYLFTNTMPFTCLTFIVFVIVTMIFKRFSFHETDTKDSVFLQAFIMLLGHGTKFETRSTAINGMFLLWIWFCLIVRIEYQGELVDGLRKKILEPHLKSLDEAIKAVDAYGGVETFREYYRGTSIAKNYKVLPLNNLPLYIKYVSDGNRFLLVSDILLIRQFRGNVQILDEPVIRAATCMFMRPGWPASKEFDRLIHRVFETGFVEKIRHDNKLERITQEYTNKSHEPNPLNMTVLGACFYGLIVFEIISFIVFILEIIYYKFIEKRRKISCTFTGLINILLD